MKREGRPVYMIGVAAEMSGVHPQTLRQYERLGLVVPARAGAKNRLYSDDDIARVRKIQRLTQEMGVNLAGVEIVLRLLDEAEEARKAFRHEMEEYRVKVEKRVQQLLANASAPIRADENLLPVPKFLEELNQSDF